MITPTADHSDNLITLNEVSFAYQTEYVLKDISFNVHRGDYLGIIGPNGGGKTTLLKIILGLLQPTSGTVTLTCAANQLGYVPQKLLAVDQQFPATVAEVVAMGRYAKAGLGRRLKAVDRAAIQQAMEAVGITDYQNRLIGKLSGGQVQRALIARAIASEPEILFLDEPTAGVDLATQGEFYELLKRLNSTMGLTLVMVSHDLDIVAKETTEIACINQTLTYHGVSTVLLDREFTSTMYGNHQQRIHHGHV